MASALDLGENAIEIVAGSNRTIEVTVTDLDGAAVDLTGARLLFCVKSAVGAEFALVQKDTDVGTEGAITKPREGVAQFFLVPSDTHNLEPDFEHTYDVWLVLPAGERHPVIPPSPFVVNASVTRIPL